ncbi:MAG: hypothetical protein ACNI3H_05575 [Halarcobacter ebronensis]
MFTFRLTSFCPSFTLSSIIEATNELPGDVNNTPYIAPIVKTIIRVREKEFLHI